MFNAGLMMSAIDVDLPHRDVPPRPRSNEMLQRRHVARKNLTRGGADWALQPTRRIAVHGRRRSPPSESRQRPPRSHPLRLLAPLLLLAIVGIEQLLAQPDRLRGHL